MKINPNIKWIWNLWSNNKKFLLLLFFMTVLSTAVAVAHPYVFKILLDSLKDILKNPDEFPTPQKEINRVIWILLVIGLTKFVAAFYPGLRAFMNYRFEYTLRKRYFDRILEKDYKFFNKYRTGDLVTRLTSDLSDFPKIGWFLCSGIFRAFDSFNKILFCLIVMFTLNVKLTLLTIAPLPIMIVIFYITSEKLYKTFKKNQEAISDINNQLEMSLSGVRIIKSFACEDKYERFFNIALDKRFDTEMGVVKLNTLLHLIYQYIDQFAQIGVIGFGGYMVVKGEITIGTFYAFYNYLSMMIYPILDLPQLFVSGKQAFVNIDRLEAIKDFPTTVDKTRGKIELHAIEKIEFKNVCFRYDGRKSPVLKDINYTTHKGERTLILGSVGTGKTTILGLLTGILKPDCGDILINDIPLEEIDMVDFREKIGFVPQEPSLFSGTIKDNIAFGAENHKDELYRRIINAVQMEHEIKQFSHKDETKIGQKGLSLSGGQKQRLAIARALIRQPEILILDDITASLDADNEEKLWQQISDMFKDITCFIVSHRLSTIRYVDNVIFLDSGIIVGKGKHQDLLTHSPEYRDFIREHYVEGS